MTGTSGSRTGRIRVHIVDDEPTPTEVLSVAVAGAPQAVVLDGMPGRAPMIHTVRGPGHAIGQTEERR